MIKNISSKEFKFFYSKVPRLCVELIIIDSRGVVLSLREIPPRIGWWHFPGGTVRFGETLAAAAKRVALDETGLKVRVEKILGVMEYGRGTAQGGHGVGIVTQVKPLSGKLRGCWQAHDVRFFKSVPRHTIPEHSRALTTYNIFKRKI